MGVNGGAATTITGDAGITRAGAGADIGAGIEAGVLELRNTSFGGSDPSSAFLASSFVASYLLNASACAVVFASGPRSLILYEMSSASPLIN